MSASIVVFSLIVIVLVLHDAFETMLLAPAHQPPVSIRPVLLPIVLDVLGPIARRIRSASGATRSSASSVRSLSWCCSVCGPSG